MITKTFWKRWENYNTRSTNQKILVLRLSGNCRGETVNRGCWAGFAPFGYASRPAQHPHIFSYITVIPNDPFLVQGGALEILV
jgi:hypothetical protein